ncbi:hypothetical protein, partial [Enterobacter hormaechei]|uniref:hypothetical protein n=2 Tax=Enterobacter hormaechei TaxID=158836 RepID=UPI001BCFA353
MCIRDWSLPIHQLAPKAYHQLVSQPLSYRVPIIYGSVNTTAEPAPFPDWLGFPTFARLSVACHHDRLLWDTALSVERLKVVGLIKDVGSVISFELIAVRGDYSRFVPVRALQLQAATC